MKTTLKGCMIGLAVAVSGAVQASEPTAVLAKVTGTVLMDREGEYRRVQPGSTPALRSGDRVFTLNGSSADVVYRDACLVHLPANSTLTLGGPGECSAGIVQVQSAPAFGTSASGRFPTGGGAAADNQEISLTRLGLLAGGTVASAFVLREIVDDDGGGGEGAISEGAISEEAISPE